MPDGAHGDAPAAPGAGLGPPAETGCFVLASFAGAVDAGAADAGADGAVGVALAHAPP